MTCPNYAFGHRTVAIELRGKTDSVCIVCACGHVEVIGEWYTSLPSTWDSLLSSRTIKLVKSFLEIAKNALI